MALHHDPPELLLRIREVKDGGIHRHVNTNTGDHIDWLPPECPQAFSVTQSSWHTWTPAYPRQGRSMTSNQEFRNLPVNFKHHDTTSMFYSTEVDSWFEVPYDCSMHHVTEREEVDEKRWNRITFAHPEQNLRIWTVGHGHEQKQIASNMNTTDSWERLLRPGSFWNGLQNKNQWPTCGLAGKISIILGLIAFTAPPGEGFGMIQRSFRPDGSEDYCPPWVTRRQAQTDWVLETRALADQGIPNRRGLIIDVAYDQAKCTPEEMKKWEDGVYGPILRSNEHYNKDSMPNTTSTSRAGPLQPGNRSWRPT